MALADSIGEFYDEGDAESAGPPALAPPASFDHDDEVVGHFGDDDEIVDAAPAAKTRLRFGEDDAIVVPAPSSGKRNKPVLAFGADDHIAEYSANPPRQNGIPERLVPLASTAQKLTPAFGQDDNIVESPTNPPRLNGTPEHLVPLVSAGSTNTSFSRAASVALNAMMNGTRVLTGSTGATGSLPPQPPTLRELKRAELRVPLTTPPERWPENPVAAPPGTPATPAPPPPESPGFGATLGEAVWRGGKEGLQDTADAFKAWHDKKTEDDDSYVGNLLQTDITKGYKSADWWGAQIGYSLAKSSPTFAAALGLGAAGTAVAGPVGGVAGGIVGFGLGSAIQEIAPAYQRARADGLSHEEAVNRAWLQSGIAGAFGAAMGAVGGPAGKAVEATIRQKIGQALADIFVKAPLIGAAHQGVSAKVEGKDLSWVDLGQGYMLNTATGAIMVGGHKLISAADGTMRGFGADELGARPDARSDLVPGSSADGRSPPETIADFIRRADETKPTPGPAPARPRTAREELVDNAVDAGMMRKQAEVAYGRMSPNEIERELGEVRASWAARAERNQEKAEPDAANEREARAQAVSDSETAEGSKSRDVEPQSVATARTPIEERAPEPDQVDSENAPGPSQARELLRTEDERIVNMWRAVRAPLPVNASAQRRAVIRGYRRELSQAGVLSAKTEVEVRNRLMDRQGGSPRAADSEIIRATRAVSGAPPPSVSRTADLIEPRPAGGVFDSKSSAMTPGEVQPPLGGRRTPTRGRDKSDGVDPASSNSTRGAPSDAVSDSGEPRGRSVKNEPASTAAEGERGDQRLTFGHGDEIVAPAGRRIAAHGPGVLPGSNADLARRRADRSLKPSGKQKPPDEELIGDRDKPPDRFDAAKKPTEPRPAGGVFDSGSVRAASLRPSSPQHTRAIPQAASEPVAIFRNVWQPKRHPDYAAANTGDARAAFRLVRDLANGENIATARQKFGTDVTYVPVSAAEARGGNTVSRVLASYYANKAGGRYETDIRRINRAYQTGVSAMARLAHRAIFRGPVTPGARYVLVDNVNVLGSTLADLADHIQRGGGEVAGAVVFVNAGRTSTLTPTKASVHDIKRRFGHAIQDLFGIAPEGLTAGEADYLRSFRDVQSLRDRAAASQVRRAVQRRAREAREENDQLKLIDPLGNSVAAPLRAPSEISGVTNDLTTNPGLFLQRAEPHIAGSGPSAPAFQVGSADPAFARKAASKGIVYLRTDVTGKLAPYVGQAINDKRYIARQSEHVKAFPKSEFRFDIVDRADPGVELDIAEHNFIQGLTGGVRARQSHSVSNDKDPIGPLRRRALGLPKAR